MIVLSLDEFSSKRRTAQQRIEDELRPEVRRAIDHGVDTSGFTDLLATVAEEWAKSYHEESGGIGHMPDNFRAALYATLKKTDKTQANSVTVERITVWLATAILSHSTLKASEDDPEELFVEWVDMGDSKVRHAHAVVAGQQKPIGEDFTVGGHKMPYPGYPGVPIELWINCRCTLRPVLAKEALMASTEAAQTSDPTHAGLAVHALDTGRILLIQRALDPTDPPEVQGTWEFPGGSIEDGEDAQTAAFREFTEETGLPIPDGEVTNGWRSEDGVYQGFVLCVPVEAEAFAEINPDQAAAEAINPDDPERRNPDVSAWFTIDQVQNLGTALRPEVAKTDWTLFTQEEDMTDTTDTASADLSPRLRWHAVLAPEGVKSGDGRRFSKGSLRSRPLPLPLTWQKQSAEGHSGNVTVAKMERVARVGDQMRAEGIWLATAEADEVIAMIAEFGRFGLSVDADDTSFEMNESEQSVDFTDARIASACIVPIPAFAEAWIALGDSPDDFFDGADDLQQDGPVDQSLVAAITLADLAPGVTEDGPGWLTHPVDTDRLRDYWTQGEGAAKIAWGVPGDFDRCRAELAEYVKPQYLSGYCANRHKDAIGVWPGQEASARDTLTDTEPAQAISLVASTGIVAPAEWFTNPEFKMVTPLTITQEGRVFGHIAAWNTCHATWADTCMLAPHSSTGYAHFLLGEVITTGGSVPCGTLSIGGGHANGRLAARPAIEHYDSTSTAFAYVTVGEDEFGIWFSGMLRPGVSDETIVDARASKLSGDWRRVGGSMEMVAALAVNTPGFAIPRVSASVENGEQMSLVAAGAVIEETKVPAEFNTEAIAEAVVKHLGMIASRKAEMNALAQAEKNREALRALAADVK